MADRWCVDFSQGARVCVRECKHKRPVLCTCLRARRVQFACFRVRTRLMCSRAACVVRACRYTCNVCERNIDDKMYFSALGVYLCIINILIKSTTVKRNRHTCVPCRHFIYNIDSRAVCLYIIHIASFYDDS